MLIPKADRKAIYKFLFSEGVCYAKKDLAQPKHKDIKVPNIYVVKAMTSLKSRKFVTEQFNWQYFYWYLTNEGIEYLRGYLGLPEDIVPNTLKKPKPAPRAAGSSAPGDRERRPFGGDRERFGGDRERRPFGAPADGDKKVGPGADFQPGFRGERGGFGRGAGAPGGAAGSPRGFGGVGRGAGREGYRREGGSPAGERAFGAGRGRAPQ
eukprot:TRINITY_DN1622_c0_g1_i3.p1 TRINITY_DN1622_c0_g1~~TRINITY_DN1622_c0_g1_i3.p1  ORF type:complete len:209 (+),score=48.82 TRINITY_DN1622_c0_g1_i3:73-699(+)